MIKPEIAPIVVFRVPKFSLGATLEECWEELKTDIAFSSPDFYQAIKDISADDLPGLPHKLSYTIWKYFNRARYRATPFGTFGAFGITTQGNSREDAGITIEPAFKVHQFVNWPQKNKLQFDYKTLIATRGLPMFCNSSYYCTHNTIRYIAVNNKQFEIAEIEKQDFILDVLEKCRKPISVNVLYEQLNIASTQYGEVLEFLLELIDLQLLITAVDPNIIGKDYFERIGVTNVDEPTPYLISEVTAAEGQLDNAKLKHVPDLVNLLQQLSPPGGKASLQKFTVDFLNKFEMREVPLMMALDPETGVGYDELEQGGGTDDFIKQFTAKPSGDEQPGIKLAEEFISAKLDNVKLKQVIALEEMRLKPDAVKRKLPNSFSIIATIADELVILDAIGGVTANALNGRFTLASETLLDISRQVAADEEAANEGVLFFDVAYMAEANVDNVNRRKLVYGHQVSILSYDTSADPLTLDDILISVRNNEVILRSRRLQKRLVPRMASAYNYGRSDLSVFRLLCDLQHQGLQSQLAFSLDKMLPRRAYYPRVQYKNLIVSRAAWRINKEISGMDPGTMRAELLKMGVSMYFKAGMADQTLCFNLESDTDLEAFRTYASKHDEVMVEEVLLPVNADVADVSGRPYAAQFILNMKHGERIYNAIAHPEPDSGNNLVAFFPPGTEWLYFELYCHPQRTDVVLQTAVAELVEVYKDAITHWFFIRYNQNGNHIRLRLHLKDTKQYHAIMFALQELVTDDMDGGLVSDLQVKTYRREIARYGEDMMEAAEQHFWRDSAFVLCLLPLALEDIQKYKMAAQIALAIGERCFGKTDDFARLIAGTSAAFISEHHLDTTDFKKLNIHYQAFLRSEQYELSTGEYELYAAFVDSFCAMICAAKQERSRQLFSDLFHMHVNRLFSEYQRTHEMVIYYLLNKDVQRLRALRKG